ncbi:SusC/RagA family TonB-linked outer membrane protein [Flavobacterium plurextorum]|nr:SusC/RagA family TonB-linked outer membrane protein [Flavobacterium plurextorum]
MILENSFIRGLTYPNLSDSNFRVPTKTDFFHQIIPDSIIIHGKITSVQGIPLAGTKISIYGTNKSVITNSDGHYQIKFWDRNSKLLIEHSGYESRIIAIKKKIAINISLQEEILDLKEVLITGYQNIRPEKSTGSFSKLNGSDITEQRLSSLNAILNGRVAGYQNGQIRGSGSIMADAPPLYVIDGFPLINQRYNETLYLVNDVPNLNLEDIENITILKDAAASSIYGAKAANGVVVITTKKAKSRSTQISYTSNLTVTPYKIYTGNLTNSAEIIDLEREWALRNPNLKGSGAAAYATSLLENAVFTNNGREIILEGFAGRISETEVNKQLNQLSSQNYKYYDDISRYAKRDEYFIQHNLSLGTANETNSFNGSLTYKSNIYDNIFSDDQSIGINLKNSVQINRWLSLDLGTYNSYFRSSSQTYSLFNPGFTYQPYDHLVNDDGTKYISYAESRYDAAWIETIKDYGLPQLDIIPLDELGMNLIEGKKFLTRTHAKFNIKFNSAFNYSVMFQYEYSQDNSRQLLDSDSYDVRELLNRNTIIFPSNEILYNIPKGDILASDNQVSNAYNFRQQINYNKTFNKLNALSFIAGMEINHNKLQYNSSKLYGWDSETLTSAPVNQTELGSSTLPKIREFLNRMVSLYSTGNYSFNDRYLLSGSLRWDRSNLWGEDERKKHAPSWSVGAGWNIDKESFFNFSFINAMKIRGSYGTAGNPVEGASSYMSASYSSNPNIGGLQGMLTNRPNPGLSAEITSTINLGLDFSILKNRIRGTLEMYNKIAEKLLTNSTGVPTEGWGNSYVWFNNGKMTNKGIELTLDGTILKNNTFSWDVKILYAYNKNKVKYVNSESPLAFIQIQNPQSFPRIGKDLNSIYAYRWAGLSNTGIPQVYDSSGNVVTSAPDDLLSVENYGTTVPPHSGSFHMQLNYKNFSLSSLFIFESGHRIKNYMIPMLTSTNSPNIDYTITKISPINKDIVNRWKQPGDEFKTNVPRVIYEYESEDSFASRNLYQNSNINIFDASNLKLSNVSLTYQIPKTLAKKAKLENMKLNLNIENVFTVAKNSQVKYLLNGFQSPSIVLGINLNI